MGSRPNPSRLAGVKSPAQGSGESHWPASGHLQVPGVRLPWKHPGSQASLSFSQVSFQPRCPLSLAACPRASHLPSLSLVPHCHGGGGTDAQEKCGNSWLVGRCVALFQEALVRSLVRGKGHVWECWEQGPVTPPSVSGSWGAGMKPCLAQCVQCPELSSVEKPSLWGCQTWARAWLYPRFAV